MAMIDRKTLEYLAGLARIDLAGMDDEKLVSDLEAILAHFEELKKVDTESVNPMTGGTNEVNVMREDEENSRYKAAGTNLQEAFREEKDGFLKVPPIFGE